MKWTKLIIILCLIWCKTVVFGEETRTPKRFLTEETKTLKPIPTGEETKTPKRFPIGEETRTNKRFPIGDFQPQQIHLAIGESESEIVVTWVTAKETKASLVHFGPRGFFQQKQQGAASLFVDGGKKHRKMWIHRVYLRNLTENTRYVYRCGSEDGWSEVFSFTAMKHGTDWPVSVAMYGDLGLVNPQSLSRLQLETEDGKYDAIIHVGDFAYDMDTKNAEVGDAFMNTIEPIAAYVPYMVCPGNHEEKYNFSNYRARFSMPLYEQAENMFYSWNMGPVHFVAVNTEAYYFLKYGLKPLVFSHAWLIADLEEASKPTNRELRPWIILFGHRPMYCSNTDHDDCTNPTCILRVGLPIVHWFGMEKILAKYGVDLAVWAHEHSYERLWPIYDYEVLNGTGTNPYHNPRGPVHITTGSAGCQERHDQFSNDRPYWSAARSTDYGYTRLLVHNKTHLYWEQVSDDQDGAVVDSAWLIRTRHEAYSHLL